jgi:C-terminal processing protease CtpA/Prc
MPACKACLTLGSDADLHVSPDVDWIRSEAALGSDLNELLRSAYRDRPGGKQFYVSQAPGVGNPVFEHELAYAGLRFPDAGYQLLALYRFWNIIAYWYPNRDVLDVNWGQVLADFIPRIALAKTKDAYQLETIALIATVTDTHANLWSAPPQLRPPSGECQLPVTTRFIENRAVVTGYSQAAGATTGLSVGDVIESLDGVPVEDLVERWAPYYPASNQPARLRDIARAMTRGACSTAHVSIRRATESVEITAQRQPLLSLDQTAGGTHDLPGDTFRLLSDQVAYLKLSSVRAAQVSSYIDRAQGTTGLVIDIRNYPSEFVVFTLGSLLVDRPTPFVRFTIGDLDNPGAFRWRGEPLILSPQQPHYSGKVVILVDENSQSNAEYTTMAFRSAPQAVVVGSTTAGADGNVSQVSLPGGLRTMISGIGVFYPDKRPTQRVGIVPDVDVRPTIAGIRAGRDEVLEEALRQILGRQTPADQIERMARPRP